jgi:hypothetical protein
VLNSSIRFFGHSRLTYVCPERTRESAFPLWRMTRLPPCALCRNVVDTFLGLEVPWVYHPDRTSYPASPSLEWVAWATLPHLPGRVLASTLGTVLRYDCQLPVSYHWLCRLALRYLMCSLALCPVPPGSTVHESGGASLLMPGLLVNRYTSASGVFIRRQLGSPKFLSCPRRGPPCSQTPVVS